MMAIEFNLSLSEELLHSVKRLLGSSRSAGSIQMLQEELQRGGIYKEAHNRLFQPPFQ